MKVYLKTIIIAMLLIGIVLTSGIFAFNRLYIDQSEDFEEKEMPKSVIVIGEKEEMKEPVEEKETLKEEKKGKETKEKKKTELETLIETSQRVNVLAFGTDGGRADTIMLLSYDPEKQVADIISIPRDTEHIVEGFDALGQNKINAVYGFKDVGGSKGMKFYLQKFLNVPIDYYVKVNYSGVEDIIDTVGGIQVNVPFRMKYDDPWATPPLHIDLQPGKQVLDGDKSVQYLRWRKNNDEYGQGDLPRIQRQQEFVEKFIDKAFGLRLPNVIKKSLKYVRTDMTLDKMLYFASSAKNFNLHDIKTYQIPGHADSHGMYIADREAMEKMFETIYQRNHKE